MDEAVAPAVSGAPPVPSPLPPIEKQAVKKPRKSKTLKSSPAKATSASRETSSASLTSHDFAKQSQPKQKGDSSTTSASVPSSSAFPTMDFNFSSLFTSDHFQRSFLQAFQGSQLAPTATECQPSIGSTLDFTSSDVSGSAPLNPRSSLRPELPAYKLYSVRASAGRPTATITSQETLSEPTTSKAISPLESRMAIQVEH